MNLNKIPPQIPIIVGIDPDSNKHGVAIYQGKKLIDLRSMQLVEFFSLDCEFEITEVHIENVCGNNATFSKSFVKNQRAQTTISRSLGMCQQSQIELERVFELLNIKVVKHPISQSWKDAKTGKKILKNHFDWDKPSNEDTRSAAHFGYLGVKAWHSINQK
tara:strand:+ start:3522 stop:4004 length:483 start_codon:yes stop_codon:yes gene_type:complete